jgi:endonuclease-3
MLSSQTKDQVVDAAVSKLQTALGGSLSIQGMIDAEDKTIAEAIAKVGFWRRKTECVAFSFSPFSALSFPTLFLKR